MSRKFSKLLPLLGKLLIVVRTARRLPSTSTLIWFIFFYHCRNLVSQSVSQAVSQISATRRRSECSHISRSDLEIVYPVEHLVRDEGVAGSNPATPTNQINDLLRWVFRKISYGDSYGDRNPLGFVVRSHSNVAW